MKLRELLQDVAVIKMTADPDMEIAAVKYDSRKVMQNDLFVAISGFVADGNHFIPMAMEKGAAVIVTAKQPEQNVPYVLVESDRLALMQIGANFYGRPAEKLKLIGVTGTNGKTSVTLLAKHVIEKTLGVKVGLIGTMVNMIGDVSIPAERTTPESLDLQALLAQMVSAGCAYAVMEVSSHAIVLERVSGIRFAVAAFTNLTEDHLDFHKTMEAYCDAKAQLFTRCEKAVANADDAWFARMCAHTKAQMLTTAVSGGADLRAEQVQLLSDGVSFEAVTEDTRAKVSVKIPGKFTVYNALTVLAIAMQLGIPLPLAAEALGDAQGVKGRIEVVPTPGKPYTVLIDYAHTPDGLYNVLSSVKDFCKGRLIVVFGSGGDRDPIKRPVMGKIGTDIADIAIITSDNPRTEEPMQIISDILAGVDSSKNNYEVIENRVAAIHRAMDIAENCDIIVLAGKGHESYQQIQSFKHHLDEREVVASYLEN